MNQDNREHYHFPLSEEEASEEEAIEDGYNRTIGRIILDRRELAQGIEKDTVFIGDLGDDLQRRFFESGWMMGRLYEQASSQASSARGTG